MKILCASTGRGGTGYMSSMLCSSGIHCGHEAVKVLNPNRDWKVEFDNYFSSHAADSNWLLVPKLSLLDDYMDTLKVIHTSRHPVSVIKSFIDIKLYHRGGKILDYIKEHVGDIDEYSLYIDYYVNWHTMIDSWQGQKIFLKFEELDFDALSTFLEHKVSPIGRIVNDKSVEKNVLTPWEEVAENIAKSDNFSRLEPLMNRFGYSLADRLTASMDL